MSANQPNGDILPAQAEMMDIDATRIGSISNGRFFFRINVKKDKQLIIKWPKSMDSLETSSCIVDVPRSPDSLVYEQDGTDKITKCKAKFELQ